ncbi:MAG: hypothetical protein KME50_32825 [Nostoc desertorum CM1-VF14]|jgi:hypothetical protein|nr:hypothetical protein [Nostoc desertorum CM1-VF14]
MILTINKLADLILSFNPQEAGDMGHGAGKKLQTRSGQVRSKRSVTTCSPAYLGVAPQTANIAVDS